MSKYVKSNYYRLNLKEIVILWITFLRNRPHVWLKHSFGLFDKHKHPYKHHCDPTSLQSEMICLSTLWCRTERTEFMNIQAHQKVIFSKNTSRQCDLSHPSRRKTPKFNFRISCYFQIKIKSANLLGSYCRMSPDSTVISGNPISGRLFLDPIPTTSSYSTLICFTQNLFIKHNASVLTVVFCSLVLQNCLGSLTNANKSAQIATY